MPGKKGQLGRSEWTGRDSTVSLLAQVSTALGRATQLPVPGAEGDTGWQVHVLDG